MQARMPIIAVVGGARCTEQQAQLAERAGELLGERGTIVMCGGRGGVMQAACKGALRSGGITLGVLPGRDRSEANPFLTIALPTGMGDARNAIVAQAADVVLAIGGSYGTLSEIALAKEAGIPVIGLGTWKAHGPSGRSLDLQLAESPEHAVELALSYVDRRG